MCTIVALFGVRDDAPLVLAANRDELYARAASGPQVLDHEHRIVGGRDEVGGGTWLAMRPDGLVVGVTNQRTLSPPDHARRSRGELVIECLRRGSVDGIEALLRSCGPGTYNPFNLLFGDGRALRVAYARDDGIVVEPLAHGVHVLANDRIGAPEYPKTSRAEQLVRPLVNRPFDELRAGLAALLGDHDKPALESIAEPPSGSRFSRELLRELSALCIHTPMYGTRSASIVAVAPGAVRAYEHADGPPCTTPFVDVRSLLE